jgi:hypothetical protein
MTQREFIKRYAGIITAKEMAYILGIERGTLARYASEMGVSLSTRKKGK